MAAGIHIHMFDDVDRLQMLMRVSLAYELLNGKAALTNKPRKIEPIML